MASRRRGVPLPPPAVSENAKRVRRLVHGPREARPGKGTRRGKEAKPVNKSAAAADGFDGGVVGIRAAPTPTPLPQQLGRANRSERGRTGRRYGSGNNILAGLRREPEPKPDPEAEEEAPLRRRILELETENKRLRDRITSKGTVLRRVVSSRSPRYRLAVIQRSKPSNVQTRSPMRPRR